MKEHGSRLFYCSDEFYVRAGLPLPSEDYYEDYSQIENGVGMITSLKTEFSVEMDFLEEHLSAFQAPRRVSIVTGVAAFDTISTLAHRLSAAVSGLEATVYCVKNNFFGESVTVAGLLTGQDVCEQLQGLDLGDELLFPAVMLRADGDVFLDDMTPAELSRRLSVPVRSVGNDGAELLCALLGVPPSQ